MGNQAHGIHGDGPSLKTKTFPILKFDVASFLFAISLDIVSAKDHFSFFHPPVQVKDHGPAGPVVPFPRCLTLSLTPGGKTKRFQEFSSKIGFWRGDVPWGVVRSGMNEEGEMEMA